MHALTMLSSAEQLVTAKLVPHSLHAPKSHRNVRGKLFSEGAGLDSCHCQVPWFLTVASFSYAYSKYLWFLAGCAGYLFEVYMPFIVPALIFPLSS